MALLSLPLSSCSTTAQAPRVASKAAAAPPPVNVVVAKERLSSTSQASSSSSSSRRRRAAALRTVVCAVEANGPTTTAVLKEALDKVPSAVPSEVILGRSSFPRGFMFGAASAAYQVEGAWNEGGRGPSIWDTFTQEQPEKIADHGNGNKATNSYYMYSEDVKLLKELGLDTYRFSISWSRILPKGTLLGGINQEGINYYNRLINELLKNGIRPFVTLFHWDLPQALVDAYGGFLDREIVNDFKDFANICFKEFGDRVKHWITLNEPWSFSTMGYSFGFHAPGRCSNLFGCGVGESTTEPYIVTHNQILAHAEVVKLYKEIYQATQQGEIGITLNSTWFEPLTKTHRDRDAAQRALDFMFGWYMEPLVYGDYPFIMRALVDERLPFFTHNESEMIKGSFDFIGINYYTSQYAQHLPIIQDQSPISSFHDQHVTQLSERNNIPIGDLQGSWVYLYPHGIKELLLYTKSRYGNPKIYITENGTVEEDKDLPLDEARHDPHRQEYISLHLAQVLEAMREGVRVKGHFTWSLTDNFEWQKGYTERFGLVFVDFDDDFKRHLKTSTKWFGRFLRS